jgi:hypothetical protein
MLRLDLRGMLAIHHACFICCCGHAVHPPILLGRYELFYPSQGDKRPPAPPTPPPPFQLVPSTFFLHS